MKKKIVLFLGLSIMMMALVGCGSGSDYTSSDEGATEEGYKFTYGSTTISISDPASEVLPDLGEYLEYNETTSCAFEGLDKTYIYEDFYLTTYPEDDADYIYSICLTSENASTQEGISIGSTQEDVETVYGEDYYNGTNAFIIEKGDTILTIIMSDETVTSIQYSGNF